MDITTVDRPTKIQRVFDYMRNGTPLNACEARKRFKVANLRATMSNLREAFDRMDLKYTVVRETVKGRAHYRVVRSRSR